jgi:ADP-heptose:LPS heptosyltransferase
MNKFKHSGTLGDIIYALPIVKHYGGGEFYLHLNQIDWVAQHYYGSTPDPFHKGRMTEQDFEFMRTFFEAQTYISKCDVLNPRTTEITHNLDRFRPLFVGHPTNYIKTYCAAFGIQDAHIQEQLCSDPWLTVPEPVHLPNKTVVIHRSTRWVPKDRNPQYDQWASEGIEQQAVFVGLPWEYEEFKRMSNWDIDYYPTSSLLELASVIAGADQFIGNQSVGLSLAIGLGVPYSVEIRRDLPLDRNEIYFPSHTQADYF